ncbi:MAG TPA: GNAT family N-acetyltransferase [Candidatus Merdenecus merdavium]|nr:GNAT family N-acetyltransferase [Candidatus Merdenecus merdavium]
MLKGIIFDMDGVLVNSEPLHYKVYTQLLDGYGQKLDWEVYKPFIGSTRKALTDQLLKVYHLPLTEDELVKAMKEKKKELVEMEGYEGIHGIPEFLQRLKKAGYLLAVASSSSYEYIKEVTNALGIQSYFDYLVSGESVEHPKPAPDVFLKTAEMMGLLPEECLVVEDSNNGVRAANAAGMACIGFENPDSGEQDLRVADMIVLGFDDLDITYIKNIHKRHFGIPLTIGETERILVRELTVDDLDDLYGFYDPSMTDGCMEALTEDRDYERERLKNYITNAYIFCGYGLWAIYSKETGDFLGQIGFTNANLKGKNRLQLGYIIGKPYRNRGYAYEAALLALNFAKEQLYLEEIHMLIEEENLPSKSLALKLQFQDEGFIEEEDKVYRHFRKEVRVGEGT